MVSLRDTMFTTFTLFQAFVPIIALLFAGSGAQLFTNPGSHSRREARQLVATGGVDFTGCQTDSESGLCCIDKLESVTTLKKDPILECTHKNVEKCHYTYVTVFDSAQEEVCEENFEKECQITFKQQAFEEQVKKCYRPLEKVCNGQGPEECLSLIHI